MKIENKELYSLMSLVKKDKHGIGVNGLYLEGFDGGITAYVTDGYALFRKTYKGDNKEIFFTRIKDIGKIKIGAEFLISRGYEYAVNEGRGDVTFLEKMKACFETEKFNKITVDGKKFTQAVRGADIINRGENNHNIALSFHEGKFDVTAWTNHENNWTLNGESAAWQLEGDYAGNGAIIVNKKYLDGVKTDGELELSFCKVNGGERTAIYLSGDIDAIIMPIVPDENQLKRFFEVLEYEYKVPEKITETVTVIENAPEPELKLVTSEKPRKETVNERKIRKPRIPRIKKQLIGDIAYIRKYTGTYFT